MWTSPPIRAIFLLMMQRILQAELLDSLSPDHPDARHNRRDLRLTNRLMGNHRWMSQILPKMAQPGVRMLEIGAGTGELCRLLAARGVTIDGLDLWPRPPAWPAAHSWHRVDLRQFTAWGDYSAVIGNLIFHQFADHELAELGVQFNRHVNLVVACEPVRRRASQTLYRRLGPLFGANRVSLHDAHVSIAAGFRGDDLSQLLGLDSKIWDCRHSTTMLGAYHLIARRRP